MDTHIKEPSNLVISWQALVSFCAFAVAAIGALWRLFTKMSKLNTRVDEVEQLAADIHDHEAGAQSLGRHLNLLLERMATVETKIEERDKNFKEDLKELKDILNKHFMWNGEDRRRKND